MPPSPSNTHSRPEQGARAFIAHVVQVMTHHYPSCTVLSINGVGAFDLVSRRAMMTAVHSMDQGEKLIPFLLQFYGHTSTHLWEDEEGTVHEIQQGAGRPVNACPVRHGSAPGPSSCARKSATNRDADGFSSMTSEP